MKLQAQLTRRLTGIGLLVVLLIVTASLAFAQTPTLGLGISINDIDDNTIVLVNQDATPATLTNTSIIIVSDGMTYTIELSDTIVPGNGILNVDFSDLGITLEEGDTIQFVYTDPDTGEQAVLSDLAVTGATAVSLNNVAAADGFNVITIALFALVTVSAGAFLRTSTEQ